MNGNDNGNGNENEITKINKVSDNEIIESAIALVDDGVNVTFPVKGWRMLPFIIGGRESVILMKPDSIAVGDVVLAWVEGCRYVVHRIIRIDGDRVTLMGDGNLVGVEHCLQRDVKARIDYVVDAQGRKHYIYNRWRTLASHLWWRLRPIRRYLLFIYRKVKGIKRI